MLAGYQQVVPPAYVTDWDHFVEAFWDRWMDPHEAEKAMDCLMSHVISQRTSVKVYNDHFNEALSWPTRLVQMCWSAKRMRQV